MTVRLSCAPPCMCGSAATAAACKAANRSGEQRRFESPHVHQFWRGMGKWQSAGLINLRRRFKSGSRNQAIRSTTPVHLIVDQDYAGSNPVGSANLARSSKRQGCETLNLAIRVQLPCAPPVMAHSY